MDANNTAVLDEVVYPESDGKRMADNTLQWDWMVKIVGELREQFTGQRVFVAGDLLWYPVKGQAGIVAAPDAMVVFGRPPGYRGSYLQWVEDGIAPQVVFEVLSPSNTRAEMDDKLLWYDRYGVEEYYFIDPYTNHISGWVRIKGSLVSVDPMTGFESPRLKIRFEENGELVLYTPQGRPFQTREDRVLEITEEARRAAQNAEVAYARAELERKRAEAAEVRAAQADARAEEERTQKERERARAEQADARAAQADARAEEERLQKERERARAEEERTQKELFAARLRELGLNPDDIVKPRP